MSPECVTVTWRCRAGSAALQGGSMVNRLLPYLGFMPWVVHRLDMHTSGATSLPGWVQRSDSSGFKFKGRLLVKGLGMGPGTPQGYLDPCSCQGEGPGDPNVESFE